jgi:two-component system, OmpR family, response regulator ResD
MLRLLLVDDDRDGVEIRRLIFERAGYEVLVERTGEGARRAFTENSPELVMLDMRLPDIEDGLALIREFRARAPKIRIIVLAGLAGDLRGRPEEQMVDAVLAKPFRSDKLVRALAKASGAGSE